MTENKNSNIELTYGEITVDKVYPNEFDETKFQAQVRQIVYSKYKQSASDSLSNDLFSGDEFPVINDGKPFEEIRVAWIPVPEAKANMDAVKAQIAKFPKARLMKILSLKPILSEEQLRSMESGLNKKTKEEYMTTQAVERKNEAGELEVVLHKGHNQCRVIKFVTSEVADIDLRPADYIEMTGDITASSTFEMGSKKAVEVNVEQL